MGTNKEEVVYAGVNRPGLVEGLTPRRGREWRSPPRSALSGTAATTFAATVVGLHKTEGVKLDGLLRTADDLELATLSWAHWFNENRLHS